MIYEHPVIIKQLPMKKQKLTLFTVIAMITILIAGLAVQNCSVDQNKKDQKKIDEIIQSMTLEQKAMLVIGARTSRNYNLPDSILQRLGMQRDEITDSAYSEMAVRVNSYLPGAAGASSEFPEIGITSQVLADGPAGLRISPTRNDDENTYYCTAFPIATLLASTWDTDLVEEVGKAMGHEVLEYGADVILGPGLNIQRDPLCGRNFEYFSEDPMITGKMAASMVNGIQSNGVGTSVKHFAVNNQETNRMSVNVIASERALREIYLKGFEIAVKEAKPWTVMSSYNKLNGPYTSESHDLLTRILRDDWGFEGYVMTDWGGGSDVSAQMKSGNDLIMPGGIRQVKALIDSVNTGALEESVLDVNLKRILGVMLKTPRYRGLEISGKPDLDVHAALTRTVATDGMVLLENRNNTLPLTEIEGALAVFGTTSYEFISGGTGSGDVNEAYTVSLIEGLKNGGLTISQDLAGMYEIYIQTERERMESERRGRFSWFRGKQPVAEMKVDTKMAESMAESSSMALITIGRLSGEGSDKEAVPGQFYLNESESGLINNVTSAFHAAGKKVVVILNIGSPIETASWKDLPDAILCAWQPGQEAGNSVVDVLSGKTNPSGHLAATFPVKYEDTPSSKNFPGQAIESGLVDDSRDRSGFSFNRRVPWEVAYEEDIYVGYRYFHTFNVPVSYEFGYGLSYTRFALDNLRISGPAFRKSIEISVDVQNTGEVPGKEVVQIYLSAPSVNLQKPALVLAGFDKTSLLEPGSSETVSITIKAMDIASFDESRSAWIIEAGEYELKAGTSSAKIHQTARFTVEKEIIVEEVSRALTPEVELSRMKQ